MASVNRNLINSFSAVRCKVVLAAAALGAFFSIPSAILAQPQSGSAETAMISPAERATYADLVTLADSSAMVVRAQIRRQTLVKPERAPGLKPGFARLYIEARTIALISGRQALGEDLVYLVDVPVNAKGKPPKLKNVEVLLFANAAGRGPKGAAQLQLAGENAQLDYSPALEARVRPVVSELLAASLPPIITGIKDALAVPGTLTGESETQIFLETLSGSPVSVTVLRRPSQNPVWGVSWGEIIDSSARAPSPETLRWYRLACALPDALPSAANLARDPDARALASRDYAFVREQLGECARSIT